MPYSLAEMNQYIDRMGSEGYLFSVFPADVVQANMQGFGVVVPLTNVDRLWTSYQKALASGLQHYTKAGGGKVSAPLLQAMTSDTGYDRMTVAAFLNGLEEAVTSQGWDWKWLDPQAAKAAGLPLTPSDAISSAVKSVGDSAGALVNPVLDPVTNLVKYGAFALVAGLLIYGIYQGNKLFGRRA